MFKRGQKVVCINDKIKHSNRPLGALRKDEIYTVIGMDGVAVWLEEIKAPVTGHYYAERFRLVETDWVEELLCKLMSEVEADELVSV
jgi:hypothetical protein